MASVPLGGSFLREGFDELQSLELQLVVYIL